jgi:hypothetical protein
MKVRLGSHCIAPSPVLHALIPIHLRFYQTHHSSPAGHPPMWPCLLILSLILHAPFLLRPWHLTWVAIPLLPQPVKASCWSMWAAPGAPTPTHVCGSNARCWAGIVGTSTSQDAFMGLVLHHSGQVMAGWCKQTLWSGALLYANTGRSVCGNERLY